MKNILPALLLAFLCSCATTTKDGQDQGLSQTSLDQYGILSSAVLSASDKMVGMYVHQIPADMDGKRFMLEIKEKIPPEQYKALMAYKIDIKPKNSYYLLLAYDKLTGRLILFDYSCDTKIDWQVHQNPEIGDNDQVEQLDVCKNR